MEQIGCLPNLLENTRYRRPEIQWKFYSLAIPKLGVILFVGKLNADDEASHLHRWGPILFLGFPRSFIPFFGVGESLKLAGFGQ